MDIAIGLQHCGLAATHLSIPSSALVPSRASSPAHCGQLLVVRTLKSACLSREEARDATWRLLFLPFLPGAQRRRQRQYCAYMTLPSANPERVASLSGPKWSSRAIKAFTMAELEARKLKYPTTGTESLLMGILTEGTSHAARYLRANGFTLFGVRDEAVKILGKADMYFFSPEHPPITEPAQMALDWAVEQKRNSGEDGEVNSIHLVLGIWAQKGSAGQQILSNLGFDDEKAKELEAFMKKSVSVPGI
eukprot:c14871_g1_i1 orf=247-993(-)